MGKTNPYLSRKIYFRSRPVQYFDNIAQRQTQLSFRGSEATVGIRFLSKEERIAAPVCALARNDNC